MTIDISKASRETLERLAMRAHEYATVKHYEGSGDMDHELDKLRAECSPKLRTRSEVDAEIATMVRIAYGAGSVELTSGAVRMTSQIEHLCAEPVRDDDPAQDERLLDVLRQALDMAPDASEATVLARVCKLRQDPPQPERMKCGKCDADASIIFAVCQQHRSEIRNLAIETLDAFEPKTKGAEEPATTGNPRAVVSSILDASALAEPLPSAIKGPPMTRDEYLVSARRLSPDPRTEPDPRPKCIRCAMRWTPPEGADATVTPCFDCCCVDPATEPEREREKADAAQSRVTELQSELAWAEEALHDSWRAIRFSLEGRAKMRALGALREEQEQTAKAISTRQDALVAGNHLGKELERLRTALGEIRGAFIAWDKGPEPLRHLTDTIKSALRKAGF